MSGEESRRPRKGRRKGLEAASADAIRRMAARFTGIDEGELVMLNGVHMAARKRRHEEMEGGEGASGIGGELAELAGDRARGLGSAEDHDAIRADDLRRRRATVSELEFRRESETAGEVERARNAISDELGRDDGGDGGGGGDGVGVG